MEAFLRNVFQVLHEMECRIERLRKEIAALHFVIPLLAEEQDWVEHGMAVPSTFEPCSLTGRRDFTRKSA